MRLALFVLMALLATVSPQSEAENDPLMLPALKKASYSGFNDQKEFVLLTDGKWEGEPYQPGGAVAPQVRLIEDLVVTGDLDGDGNDEAVVLLNYTSGGTGQFLYLAVVDEQQDQLDNVATELVGDRVRIRDLRIENSKIVLDVVQAGPDDAACCPGEVAERLWQFDGRSLQEEQSAKATLRLVPEVLSGTQWVLEDWKHDEPDSSLTAITLVYKNGKFIGQSGCNNYLAAMKVGDLPGEITVYQPAVTRKACSDPDVSEAETRYLQQLQNVHQFSFYAGKLGLSYGQGSDAGVMLFTATREK
ncbi:META domain-containing protein [Photobacterium sagamiensis]|uniref:META domain-containing protein n=1 Tax=Photobacterium sagamiensis TaxID=2910241 RepID=UPI003D14A1F9